LASRQAIVAPALRADRHVRAYDGLRGIAILLVLLRHLGEDGPASRVGGVFEAALKTGWLGVDVFFVLSGFLITGILVDARGEAAQPPPGYFRSFYARRALRIFPAYYLFLAVVVFIGRPSLSHGSWWYWSYLSNALIAWHGWPDGTWDTGHLWSLAVEEQFYLVWPTIIALTPRRGLPSVCLLCVLAAIALRFLLILRGYALAAYVLTPARADTLAIGAVLAIALRAGPRIRDAVAHSAPPIGMLALCMLAVLFATHGLDHRLSYGGLVVGSLATTLATASCIARIGNGGRLRRALEWAPLVSFGTYSYAVYLVQLPIRGAIDFWLGPRLTTWPAMLGVATEAALLGGGSWCMAWTSWRLFERPILSLKRFVPMPHRHERKPSRTSRCIAPERHASERSRNGTHFGSDSRAANGSTT
jgi:peptidoglycan/LPS O-acetylase OafA/YrhL